MEKLGKYVIVGELGRGAGGVVYRARDPILNRLVALKTITTGLADFPDLLQRFYQEAQSAGGLQHANIVTIYDLGDEKGIPYIAMELLEGESLDQLIGRRPQLPVPLKLTYALQACRAFDYAHKRGIIHRDIKPDNVMLTKDGTVKVVDFGIARVLETSKTQTGMLLGTFAYMSPEQYHGEHADARSDIWSFGILLYELLAYQRPFKGPTPAGLMHSICQQEMPSLVELVPECPVALENVLLRTLRKSAEERYQSMEELILDLDPICKSLQTDSVLALVAHARELSGQGDYSHSRDLLQQALQIDSSNTQARNLLDKVNAELRRILMRPKLQQQVEKGHALLAEGKIREAKAEAETVLQMDSNFEPGQGLLKLVQAEISRARQVVEWIETAKQRLAQGILEEAEELLAKVIEAQPANAQGIALQQELSVEKAERQRRLRLFEKMQEARGLWTQQNYGECIQLLTELRKEFPQEDEIPRLLETAKEDQAIQQRLQGLADARSMLANQRYDECKDLLTELLKQFPEDEEIVKLREKAVAEQKREGRLQSLAEARSLLAARRYEECNSLLSGILKEFPGDKEIVQLQANVLEDQRKQKMLEAVREARNLLAAKQYDESIARLTSLEKEFPGEADIAELLEAARGGRAEQERQQGVAMASKLLAGRQFEECNQLLRDLQKRFPADGEILRLVDVVRKDQAEQRRRQSLTEAGDLLGARKYDECVALLAKLQSQHPKDNDIAKLMQAAQDGQAEQRKLKSLTEARSMLASRQYEECITSLLKLQSQYPEDNEITKLLETAREGHAEEQKQRQLAEARKHLAAKRFDDAITVIETLCDDHPKDSGVFKLRSLVVQEKEKQASMEQLQAELKSLKRLVSEKKYPDVLAKAESIQKKFPGNTDLEKLIEFSRTQQAEIERESQQQTVLREIKGLMDSSRYEEAYHAALAGLKTFPGNKELVFLKEQADSWQRKLETRQHIEQRIREIKVKINRGKISEAIDLANHTLVNLGPDTDLTQLLNSAQVELQAREKKKKQEDKLEAVRGLISAGKFLEASKTLDQAVVEKTLELFDPRVQRVCEELEFAKSAAFSPDATGIKQTPVKLSKEYAWLQVPPAHSGSGPVVEQGKPSTSPTGSSPKPEAVEPASIEQGTHIMFLKWREEERQFLAALEKHLAMFVGPMAGMIVRKAAAKTKDPRELLKILASTLPSEKDRRAFLARKNELLHGLTQIHPLVDLSAKGTQMGSVAQILPVSPAASELTPEAVRYASELLARRVGPISRVLAERAAKRADSLRALYALLAEHLEDSAERARFLSEAGFPES